MFGWIDEIVCRRCFFGREINSVSKDFNFYVAGNLICGGPLGLAIDFLSGAIWTLDPEEIYVSLDTAELANGQKELYALFNYYDESQGSVVSLPIKLDKIN